MLIPVNEIRLIFEKISKKALEGGTTVVILCSYEVDSLGAAQILTVTFFPTSLNLNRAF